MSSQPGPSQLFKRGRFAIYLTFLTFFFFQNIIGAMDHIQTSGLNAAADPSAFIGTTINKMIEGSAPITMHQHSKMMISSSA